jgi:hypothetical protein
MLIDILHKIWDFTNLQRNVGCSVVRNYFSDLPYIAVAILALMESETPVGHHSRETGKSRILYGHILGTGTGQEIKVNNTTKGIVLEELAVRVVNLNIHTLRTSKKDAMSTVFTSVVKVDGVGAVEVGSWRSAICITVPQLMHIS